MRKEYDFSNARPNPYAKRLKRAVTIRLDTATIDYFKRLAAETEIPYQTLINLYLRDCALHGRKLAMQWRPADAAPPNPRIQPTGRRGRQPPRGRQSP